LPDAPSQAFSALEREEMMRVFTRRATEEVRIAKPVRLVVLKTAPDEVKFGLLDSGDDVRRTCSDPDRPTRKRVKVIAPYGEEIEVDT
jgi:hypothetical protein